MRSVPARLAAAVALAAVTACDRPAPTGLAPSARASLSSGGGGGAAVSVGGQYTGAFGEATVTGHAVLRRDGTVGGQFEQHNPSLDLAVHGDVRCVNVIGKQAYISGVITNVKSAGALGTTIREGSTYVVAFEDNGEGANAAADRVTPFLYFGDGAQPDPRQSCLSEDYLTQALGPLTSGNVQVAP